MSDASLDHRVTEMARSADPAPAITGLVTFLAVAILLTMVRGELLNDPDTQWHIATGGWIVTNRAWPDVDSFSHSFAGQPWIAKEWLSQLVLHGAYRFGGWSGVTFVTVLATAGSIGLLAGWLAARLRVTLVIAAIALVVLLSAASLVARPHILALPLMVLWTLGLISAAERGTPPRWWLIFVMVLWANAHAGFTIGFVIAGFLALEAMWRAGRDGWFVTGRAWAMFGAAALLASCVTPYGPQAYIVTLKLFGTGEPLPFIREWQPLERDAVGLVSLGLLAILVALLGRQPLRNLPRLMLIVLLGWMMIRHSRFSLLFAFAAWPLVASPLATVMPALRANPGDTLAGRRLFALGAATLAGLLALTIALPAPKPNPRVTPLAALEAARRAGLAGPVFNAYDFGGFLIAQGVPTLIDGRTDQLFLGGFFGAYEAARTAPSADALSEFIQRHRIAWALIDAGAPEVRHFMALGWRQIHLDPVAVVFAPPAR
jgi:hypothetical protein